MDKIIERVKTGLKMCENGECKNCPYTLVNRGLDCENVLFQDTLNVLNDFQEELKKKNGETVEKKSGFITLTTGAVMGIDDQLAWYDTVSIAVKVDDILMICDVKEICGSEIRLKTAQKTVVRVKESIEEILGKIAEAQEDRNE